MTTLRLNFEGLKAAPGDAVESSYFLSNILGPVPTPALFTNVNYISNIIIDHTDLLKETWIAQKTLAQCCEGSRCRLLVSQVYPKYRIETVPNVLLLIINIIFQNTVH